MKFKKHLLLFLLPLISVSISGCVWLLAGAGAGAGTVAYIKGEVKILESAPLENCWAASMKGLDSLKFHVINKQKDAISAKIIARTALDKKVIVRLKKMNESQTEIRIRVGTFGDQTLSLQVLEKIKKYLKR